MAGVWNIQLDFLIGEYTSVIMPSLKKSAPKKDAFVTELLSKYKKRWDNRILVLLQDITACLDGCQDTKDLWWNVYDWSRYTDLNLKRNVKDGQHISGSLRDCMLCLNDLEHG